MMDLSNILKIAKEHESKYQVTDSSNDAEKLRAKLLKKGLSKTECLELQQEVIDFLASDAPESDKSMIMGYSESLSMICSAIKEDLLR